MCRDNDLGSLSKADDALISQSGERGRLASPASRATTDVRRVDWCCKHSPSSALVVDQTGCLKKWVFPKWTFGNWIPLLIFLIVSYNGEPSGLPTSGLPTSWQYWGWQFWVYPLLRIANPNYHKLYTQELWLPLRRRRMWKRWATYLIC